MWADLRAESRHDARMIGKLKGMVDGVGAEEALIDVHGAVYVVACGARTLQRLPAPGEAVTLHIETVVREDLIRLYGFASEDDRAWFVRLQAIQGVGAKVALAILDVLDPAALQAAADMEDKTAVSRAKGVGPRVAQRVVAELKGKPAPQTRHGVAATGGAAIATAPGAGPTNNGDEDEATRRDDRAAGFALRNDAISALVNLGLPEDDVRAAVIAAQGATPEAGVDALVKAALKEIGR